jgi:endonuclease/exonuclease/phosphatase (EEP) superfamily protein YafD
LLIYPETGELTGWVDWGSVQIVPAWFAAREVEAFQAPEMYNIYEEMQRQIKEAEVYWKETNVPEENRIESRKNVLTMRLRERFRDAAGATADMEEKEAEKVVFMEMFDRFDLDAARVLE